MSSGNVDPCYCEQAQEYEALLKEIRAFLHLDQDKGRLEKREQRNELILKIITTMLAYKQAQAKIETAKQG